MAKDWYWEPVITLEHWDESLWRDDLRRMLENGIEVILNRRVCME